MSRLFEQLGAQGFLLALWETLYMTFISTAIAYAIGLPLGGVLAATDKDGISPRPIINKALGFAVNVLRSIPFIILIVAFIPLSRAIVGTGIGNRAMVVMLIVASAPYIARMVESSLKEVDRGVIEAAKAMGASNLQIFFKVLLPEAKPSLIVGGVISAVTVLSYSAMAGTIGGGGLGALAVTQARASNAQDVIWLCVGLTVIAVQLIQEAGVLISQRSDKRLRLARRKRSKRTSQHIDNDELTEKAVDNDKIAV